MAIRNNWTTSDVMPLYTTGGNASQTPRNLQANQDQTKTSRASMYQGWSVQGIWRFNILYDLVEKDLDSEAGTVFEEQFLQYMQDKKEKGKQKDAKKNTEYEMCRHDLWVMDDDNGDSKTSAHLENGLYKNNVRCLCNTDEKNNDEENSDEEIDVEETDFNENDDEENDDDDDDDNSSASLEGFNGRAVPV